MNIIFYYIIQVFFCTKHHMWYPNEKNDGEMSLITAKTFTHWLLYHKFNIVITFNDYTVKTRKVDFMNYYYYYY